MVSARNAEPKQKSEKLMEDYYDNEVRADCRGAQEAKRAAERISDNFSTALGFLREI